MGFLGIPGQGEAQQRLLAYTAQQQAQRSQFARQRQLATGQIGRAVASATGVAGNPTLGGRLAAREAGRVQGDIANSEAAASDALRAQQAQAEQQAQRADMDTQRQMIGGLIGGAGQVLGMAVPAFGALGGGGVASALGSAATGTPSGQPAGLGSLAQAVIGQPAAPAPVAAPMVPQAAPAPSPSIGTLGGAGPIGSLQQPAFSSPSGEVETFEERMRRLQGGGRVGVGGGFAMTSEMRR